MKNISIIGSDNFKTTLTEKLESIVNNSFEESKEIKLFNEAEVYYPHGHKSKYHN